MELALPLNYIRDRESRLLQRPESSRVGISGDGQSDKEPDAVRLGHRLIPPGFTHEIRLRLGDVLFLLRKLSFYPRLLGLAVRVRHCHSSGDRTKTQQEGRNNQLHRDLTSCGQETLSHPAMHQTHQSTGFACFSLAKVRALGPTQRTYSPKEQSNVNIALLSGKEPGHRPRSPERLSRRRTTALLGLSDLFTAE
jgi:hypothetical protein